MRVFVLSLLVAVIGAVRPASAALNVFACEPEWAALAKEIGKDKVDVYAATTGAQDPHQIQARPSLIAKARNADITVCTGAELEVGWLPALQKQAANPKIQPGSPGAFVASAFVQLMEIPTRLDRADGDIHASGNPHIQTDPRNILAVAKPMADRFAELDPANAAAYQAGYADFAGRWNAALAKWTAAVAPLKGTPIAVQHRTWVYLLAWTGMREVVALEPKPGVPPSSGYLAEVLTKLQTSPVKMILRSAYEDDRSSVFVAERTKVPAVALPFTVGGTDEAKDLFSLFDETVKRLLASGQS